MLRSLITQVQWWFDWSLEYIVNSQCNTPLHWTSQEKKSMNSLVKDYPSSSHPNLMWKSIFGWWIDLLLGIYRWWKWWGRGFLEGGWSGCELESASRWGWLSFWSWCEVGWPCTWERHGTFSVNTTWKTYYYIEWLSFWNTPIPDHKNNET